MGVQIPPTRHFVIASLAQLVEQRSCKAKVVTVQIRQLALFSVCQLEISIQERKQLIMAKEMIVLNVSQLLTRRASELATKHYCLLQ